MKNKYIFSKKFQFWINDHYKNFKLLKNIFRNRKNLNFLEIGILEGRTTIWLLENILTNSTSFITCIEPKLLNKTKHNLSYFKDKIRIIEMPSFLSLVQLNYEIYFNKGKLFDFIYIDGDHNAPTVLLDLILSWKILKKNGILLLDDYEMSTLDSYFYKCHKEFQLPQIRFIHPKLAIDYFLSLYRGLYKKIIDNYQIGLQKITDFSSDISSNEIY